MDVTEFDGLDNLQFSGKDWIPRAAIINGASVSHQTGSGIVKNSSGTVRGVIVGFDGSCAAGDSVEILDDTTSKAKFFASAADETGYNFFSTGISCSTSIKTGASVTGSVTILVIYE